MNDEIIIGAEPEPLVSEQKLLDRKAMALGQKMATLLLPAVQSATAQIVSQMDGRAKICFWNGLMAEVAGAACADLGCDMATVMFNHINGTLMPKLVAKITGRPQQPQPGKPS